MRLDTLDSAATTFENPDSKISLVSKALENLQSGDVSNCISQIEFILGHNLYSVTLLKWSNNT